MTIRRDMVPGSFRDPSGFVFRREGQIYRQVNQQYRKNYDLLMSSGLYERLVRDGFLVSHEEVGLECALTDQAYKVIYPEQIPFISYPYEWSFSQLKDAALITLQIQKSALDFGLSLKDCSAYNVQFKNGKPVFIDTLSFEAYREGAPWTAYRQFCQHFLAPLALMAYRDARLSQLLRVHIDGIPLDLTSRLLPLRTYARLPLLIHIHLHARAQQRYADTGKDVGDGTKTREVSRVSQLGLIDSLQSGIKRLCWKSASTEWVDYYTDTNYTVEAVTCKQQLASRFLERVQPHSVWDLGANTGLFSRLSSDQGIFTVAFDIDPGAVERNYLRIVEDGDKHLLPLLLDLMNPSPGIGWANQERVSLRERGPADAILALALIHHLAIANNVPLERIARFFSKLGEWLIIEFVPKRDSQVQRLLANREDIFPEYTQSGFEEAFVVYYQLVNVEAIEGSERTMYLMRRRPER